MKETMILSPKWAYLVLSIPIIAAISWSVANDPLYTFYYSSDFWEHSATIREWTGNLWHPGNPHLAIDTGSPRYMPFFFLLTVLARTFNLNPIHALGIGGFMTMIVFYRGLAFPTSLLQKRVGTICGFDCFVGWMGCGMVLAQLLSVKMPFLCHRFSLRFCFQFIFFIFLAGD